MKTAVTLVLGSGGARGLAHIGIIRALKADGRFEIKGVTGTSVGALVGGLYAAGKLDDYAEWVRGLTRADIWKLLDFSFTGRGLFEGERLMTQLAEMLGEARIEDLPIRFTAVASDLKRRQEVWLDHGPLFDAIRASIAIPGLFTPIERDGRLLADGGLLSPLPVIPAMQHDASCVIAVSLNGATAAANITARDGVGAPRITVGSAIADPQGNRAGERSDDEPVAAESGGPVRQWLRRAGRTLADAFGGDQPPGGGKDVDALDVIAMSIEAMQDRIARYQLAACRPDLLIEIPVDACGVLEFDRGDEMIALGEQIGTQALQSMRDGRAADTGSAGKPTGG